MGIRVWISLWVVGAGAMVMGMGLGEFTARRDRSARSVCSGVMCVCVFVYNMSGTGAISATLMRGER